MSLTLPTNPQKLDSALLCHLECSSETLNAERTRRSQNRVCVRAVRNVLFTFGGVAGDRWLPCQDVRHQARALQARADLEQVETMVAECEDIDKAALMLSIQFESI
jgi:hypothetical protein